MIRFPLMSYSLLNQNRLAESLQQHRQYRPRGGDLALAAARAYAQQQRLARHRDQVSMDGDVPDLERPQAARWRANSPQARRSTAASARSSFPWIRDPLFRRKL